MWERRLEEEYRLLRLKSSHWSKAAPWWPFIRLSSRYFLRRENSSRGEKRTSAGKSHVSHSRRWKEIDVAAKGFFISLSSLWQNKASEFSSRDLWPDRILRPFERNSQNNRTATSRIPSRRRCAADDRAVLGRLQSSCGSTRHWNCRSELVDRYTSLAIGRRYFLDWNTIRRSERSRRRTSKASDGIPPSRTPRSISSSEQSTPPTAEGPATNRPRRTKWKRCRTLPRVNVPEDRKCYNRWIALSQWDQVFRLVLELCRWPTERDPRRWRVQRLLEREKENRVQSDIEDEGRVCRADRPEDRVRCDSATSFPWETRQGCTSTSPDDTAL